MMDPKLKDNLKALPTNYTTYVVAVLMAVAGYWLQMSPTEQAELIGAYPWLKHAAPVLGLVAFLGARVWPQGKPPQEYEPMDTRPLP